MTRARLLLGGLAFAESPRWHAGALWFSDFYTQLVHRLDAAGVLHTECEVPGQPSGLGWLPDGRLLVVSMTDRRLLRREPDGRLVQHADLSSLAAFHCNDMVVDAAGRAYVGNFGYDLLARAAPAPAELVLVEPDGSARVVARELGFPNGSAISPDGRMLIVAETAAKRLTAFDIGADGSLSNRRLWADLADLGPFRPDGICLDAEGAVWAATVRGRACIRVAEGGALLDRIDTADPCIACMLGGEDRRTLYIVTGEVEPGEQALARRGSAIWQAQVAVPGAGWP